MNNAVSSKEQLIAECKELVRVRGIQGVSIRSLAKQAGISTGAVYNYFSSKNQLLIETIGSIWAEIFHLADVEQTYPRFTDYLRELLASVAEGKKRYPHFFSEHALAFSFDEKQQGQQAMAKYRERLKEKLYQGLRADTTVRQGVFTAELSQEEAVDYIFALFLTVIIEGKSPESLLKFVENSLY